MKYAKFCEYLAELEKTSKRLEITDILAELIEALDADEVEVGIFLALGYLNPPYNQIKFNMADKMVVRALELCYGVEKAKVEKMYSEVGDLGDVALALATTGLLRSARNDGIKEIREQMVTIAVDEGAGSQDRKIVALSNLLKTLSPLSAKYTIKIVLGTTRLGFTEQTVINALSKILSGDKSASRTIEEVYNIHPDVGFIAKTLKKEGLKGIGKIRLETGVPVLSQKAQRLSDPEEILEKMAGTAWAEYKLDGTRVQLHLDRQKTGLDKKLDQNALFAFNKGEILVKTFTRNLEENTYQFPDVVESALNQLDATSIILDGEAVGFDPKTSRYIPFQDMMQRKRKHHVGDYAKQIPLKYIVFDILYLNGKDLTPLSLNERHRLLESTIERGEVLEVAKHIETADPVELWQFFELSKEKNLEGIMVKNPQAPYRAGAREFSWIKLKRSNTDILEDTVDCVVLGYYFGRGSRAAFGIGGFLCGIWDKDEQVFTTLTKVGTGLRDEEWVELKKRCDKLKVKEAPKNVKFPKILTPDVWVTPEVMVELGGDEISVSQNHTSGYALRFPRLITFRDDKSPADTTSPKEILALHKSQRKPDD
ncbi:DNA ligase [candidate division WWE3 bacterium CG08_land_8_20_14_0_20_41_10]|uniref:DNA ligase n=1 Tax=candidate division WWE3 bacterium CG08_land_8_20_14_0_20_41_10 TaxID=1975085 RepID=A0A2H0XCD3_UNCKA|nr:MAG: DNA ligase [candidate division WWE3 bacterium CG08_land_8_20_14_0_20_41_10]